MGNPPCKGELKKTQPPWCLDLVTFIDSSEGPRWTLDTLLLRQPCTLMVCDIPPFRSSPSFHSVKILYTSDAILCFANLLQNKTRFLQREEHPRWHKTKCGNSSQIRCKCFQILFHNRLYMCMCFSWQCWLLGNNILVSTCTWSLKLLHVFEIPRLYQRVGHLPRPFLTGQSI